MYFVQFLIFFWLGLTGYCSSQWANLVDATSSAPQNELNDNSGIDYDTIGNGGWDSSSPGSNSPEMPITIPAEDFQACSSKKYEQSPIKRRLRREWCRDNELAPNTLPATTTNPKHPSSVQEDKPKDEGSEAGQLDSGEKTPITNENPQLPSFPGRERFPGQLDSNPCNEPRTNPVCSALEIRRALYPFSLVWKATWLDYCRMYYPGQECLVEAGEKIYCCQEVRNETPAPSGKSYWYYRYRAKYPIAGQDCMALA